MDSLVDPQNLIREIYCGEITLKFFSLENYKLYGIATLTGTYLATLLGLS